MTDYVKLVQTSGSAHHPQVSIIVPAYNAAWSLPRCLDALLSQDTAVAYEIIVSDDGSTDDTPQLMGRYARVGRVRYVRHENVRPAANRNIGAGVATGRLLIFLDSDMIPTPGFITAHAEALIDAGDAAIISGPLPIAQECEAHPTGRFLARKWERRLQALQRDPDNVFLMQSGNFSIARSLFDHVGGFDSGFREYSGEDTDFFARSYLLGARFLYCPLALAHQLVACTFSPLLAKAASAGRMSALVMRRYPTLAPRALVAKAGQRHFKGRIWNLMRRARFSTWLLLHSLPLVERVCPDRIVFLFYNSLLSEYRRRATD